MCYVQCGNGSRRVQGVCPVSGGNWERVSKEFCPPPRCSKELEERTDDEFRSQSDPSHIYYTDHFYPAGNDARKRLIEKVGKWPVNLPPVLYDLIAAKLKDLDSEWEQKKANMMAARRDDDTARGKWVLNTFATPLVKFVRGRREFKMLAGKACGRKFEPVARVIHGGAAFWEESCCLRMASVRVFYVHGFVKRPELNGEYTVDEARHLNGHPTYWRNVWAGGRGGAVDTSFFIYMDEGKVGGEAGALGLFDSGPAK